MEAANYCVNKVKRVTVVLRGDIPFKPLLGPVVGSAFMKLFKDKGVHFVTGSGLTRVNEDGHGNVVSVELKDGKNLFIYRKQEKTNNMQHVKTSFFVNGVFFDFFKVV